MGGTKILSAIINSKKGIVSRIKKPTGADGGRRELIKTLVDMVKRTVSSAEIPTQNIKAVCLGVPGAVNPYTGVVMLAPNIGLKNFNIKRELEKHITFPVIIENDVNLGALGIKHFGLGKNAVNMLAVFIGTGIGGGLILNKKIFRGANFAAGEIGHIRAVENGPLCGCGKSGCLEAVASRSAITNRIIDDIKAGKQTVLAKHFKAGEIIKSRALANAVKKNDKVVIQHLNYACRLIGLTLADITNLLNLDLIVLGGGLIDALNGFMMPAIRKSFAENIFPASSGAVKILPAILGDDAALFGGIPLAEEFLGIRV